MVASSAMVRGAQRERMIKSVARARALERELVELKAARKDEVGELKAKLKARDARILELMRT